MKIFRPGVAAILLGLVFCFGLYSEASGQNLVELARKEKQRRESLKSRQTVVVTNDDLKDFRTRGGIRGYIPDVVSPAANITVAGQETQKPAPPAAGSSQRIIPRVADSGPAIFKSQEEMASPAELKENLKKTKEMIDLLETRINGFWQELYALNDGDSRDEVIKKLGEAERRLDEARQEEAKLAALLEKADKAD